MSALEQAIEALYAAFSNVSKPASINACPCCLEEERICKLLSASRRQLSPEDLSEYAACAFNTVGGVDDYLYFLPRILEISATEPSWWPDFEVTGQAVRETNPSAWPKRRIIAFSDFLDRKLASLLEEPDSGSDIDSWVCGIGKTGADLAPFLKQIENYPKQVISFYEANAGALGKGRLRNAFWKPEDPGYQELFSWFGSDPVGDLVLSTYGVSLYWSVGNQ